MCGDPYCGSCGPLQGNPRLACGHYPIDEECTPACEKLAEEERKAEAAMEAEQEAYEREREVEDAVLAMFPGWDLKSVMTRGDDRLVTITRGAEECRTVVVRSQDAYLLGELGCPTCEEPTTFKPSHWGSTHCRSGSLASGGQNAHCTCDSCF